MTMRILIISNPAAGQRGSNLLHQVMANLEARGAVVTHIATRRAGELEQIVNSASTNDWDRIAIAGGDGSLMEAVNGWSENTPPIGLIPMGTANVVSLELGLPTKPDALADLILQGSTEQICVPETNGRRFVFCAGAGFDAYLVTSVSGTLKKHLGKLAFVIATVRALKRYRFPRLDIVVDGVSYSGVGIIIMNGSLYGGPYNVAPDRQLSDPVFSVIVLTDPGARSAISYITAMLRGRLHKHSGVKFIQSATSVDVSGPGNVVYQTDGDKADVPALHARADSCRVHLIASPRRAATQDNTYTKRSNYTKGCNY